MSSVIEAICFIIVLYISILLLSFTRLEHNWMLVLMRYLLGVKTEAQILAEEALLQPVGAIALLDEWIAGNVKGIHTN